MRARMLLLLCAVVLIVPGLGSAALDVTCSPSFTRIEGTVKNMVGTSLPGIAINVYSADTNAASGTPRPAYTNSAGFYSLCLSSLNNGLTYQVQASDPLSKYETKAEPFHVDSGITTVTGVDFELPLRLTLNLSPNAITNISPTTMEVTVRSTADPTLTTIHATFDVLGDFILTGPVAEPSPSPFWVYKKFVTIPTTLAQNTPGQFYMVRAYGTLGATKWTSTDQQPFVVDRTRPSIAPDAAGSFGVGVGLATGRATSTTNPQPTVLLAIKDDISGVNPQTVFLTVDGTPFTPTITGTANRFTVSFTPSVPLSLGPHSFHYTAQDYAGNSDDKTFTLTIVVCCGQKPIISSPGPSPVHIGNNSIPALTFGMGANNTYPEVTCYITDPDGQYDIAAGTIRVRLFYGDVEKAHYDPTVSMPGPNPSNPNTGQYFQNTGLFKLRYNYATGAALPGVYTVLVEVSDHGGNSATYSWDFILAFAV